MRLLCVAHFEYLFSSSYINNTNRGKAYVNKNFDCYFRCSSYLVLIWPKAATVHSNITFSCRSFPTSFSWAQSDLFRITKMSTVELILQGLLGLGIILILLPIMKKLLVFIVDNFKY